MLHILIRRPHTKTETPIEDIVSFAFKCSNMFGKNYTIDYSALARSSFPFQQALIISFILTFTKRFKRLHSYAGTKCEKKFPRVSENSVAKKQIQDKSLNSIFIFHYISSRHFISIRLSSLTLYLAAFVYC